MVTNGMWPPRVSDRPAVLDAYEDVMGWRLQTDGVPVRADAAKDLLDGDPAAALTTPCTDFDLVIMPYHLGLDTLVLIERADLRIPCVLSAQEAVFLVRPTTGKLLADIGFVRVESGPEAALTLPPSPDARWDTPPWHSSHPQPLPLQDAMVLAPALVRVRRTRRGGQPG